MLFDKSDGLFLRLGTKLQKMKRLVFERVSFFIYFQTKFIKNTLNHSSRFVNDSLNHSLQEQISVFESMVSEEAHS
jgi:hypothetical protein